jgi:hypothetical protein
MADLIKGGARKLRIERGTCYTGNNYDSRGAHERGVMPEMCYDLTVTATHLAGGSSYTARLTEVEMLRTIQDWLARFNSHQDQKRRAMYAKQS